MGMPPSIPLGGAGAPPMIPFMGIIIEGGCCEGGCCGGIPYPPPYPLLLPIGGGGCEDMAGGGDE
jgi:hypothetical protein